MNKYRFKDGVFTFWTAHYGSWARDARIVFRVREDSTPEKRAEQKSIRCWDRLFPAQEDEIEQWRNSHKDYPVLKVLKDKGEKGK